MEKYIVQFLCSFFKIFECHILKVDVSNETIIGRVSFDDNSGCQNFKWDIRNVNFSYDGILLIDFLLLNNLINGDRIVIPFDELSIRLESVGWTKEKGAEAISYLLSIKIIMIDEGKESDYFFIHFE